MKEIFQNTVELLSSYGLVTAFCYTAILYFLSKKLASAIKNRVDASAIAIGAALVFAGIAGLVTGGTKGMADVPGFSGLGILGGTALRDLAIVSTAVGVDFKKLRSGGPIGLVSVLLGTLIPFFVGVGTAYAFGYRSAVDLATIGAGCNSFIVGPVTGSILGADSSVIALSISAGLAKTILIMLVTPYVAKAIRLTTPRSAMIFGGIAGTTSGVSVALAVVNEELIPYGAVFSALHTSAGCLLCPTVLYAVTALIF